MHVLIIYDIRDDRLRTRVSNTLKDWGLERIQYSVFIGVLASRQRKMLEGRLNELLETGGQEDSIITISICNHCLHGVVSLGSHRELNQYGPKVVLV